MKRVESSILVGIGLIGIGVLFLLQNIGALGAIAGLIWAFLFAVGGLGFLLAFMAAPARWWALIPGFTLLGLASLIGLQELAPALGAPWGGGLFLGGIGLGFCAVYLTSRERWWAIIPAGALLTLALIAGLSSVARGRDLGWLLFFGLAVTFGLVAIVPTPRGHMRWALYPAGVMLIMALVVMSATVRFLNFFWPAAMILAGLYLAFRSARTRQAQPIVEAAAPLTPGDAPAPGDEAAPLAPWHEVVPPAGPAQDEEEHLETVDIQP